MTEESEMNLPNTFNAAWSLFQEIEESSEPSNSTTLQSQMGEATRLFEEATRMVNSLALFSRNEHVDELPTADVKYLLLPAFLGEISLKRTSEDRAEAVNTAKVYFMDFIDRCKTYEIADKGLVIPTAVADQTNKQEQKESREKKIERYKEKKALDEKINAMKVRLKDNPDGVEESDMRKYYTDWIRVWTNNAVENLQSISSELEILAHMRKMKESGGLGTNDESKPPLPPPMKPILITREMMQRGVFGAGYRSLPTMTEDEFFEKELREGKIVADFDAANPAGSNGERPPAEESDSADDDDEEKLQKKRDWDEWKDTHRRGDGNKEKHG